MSDVSVSHFDEKVGCKGNYHSLGEWRHLVSYQVAQLRTGGHSDMTAGMCSRRIRCECKLFHHCDRMCSCLDENGKIFHHCDRMCSCLDESGKIFHHCDKMCSCLDESGKIFHHCDRMCSCLDESGKIFHHCDYDVFQPGWESSITVIGCVPVWMDVPL